jgi:hypothetical protein
MKSHRFVLPFFAALIAVSTAAPAAFAAETSPSYRVTEVGVSKRGEKPPTCRVFSTRKTVRAGEKATIVWKSKRADSMTGLYTNEKRDPNGRLKVLFGHAGVQNFSMLFEGPGGKTTCDLTVVVKEKKANP